MTPCPPAATTAGKGLLVSGKLDSEGQFVEGGVEQRLDDDVAVAVLIADLGRQVVAGQGHDFLAEFLDEGVGIHWSFS